MLHLQEANAFSSSHGHLNIPFLVVPKDPILLSWGPVADVLIPEGLRVDHWSWAMCVCTKAQPHLNQSPISCWALSTASLPWQMLRPTWGRRMTEKLPTHEQLLSIPVYSSLLWLFQACWLQGWSLQASPWHEPAQIQIFSLDQTCQSWQHPALPMPLPPLGLSPCRTPGSSCGGIM